MGLCRDAVIMALLCTINVQGNVAFAIETEKPDESSYMEYIMGGFRTPPELSEINDLIKKRNLAAAQEKATNIINRKPSSFSSTKRENFLKGQAFFLRGEIAAELGDNEAALEDMKRATEFGHPFAPYQVAARLVIRGALTNNPSERQQYLHRANTYYLACAELGDSVCIDHIQVALRAQKKLKEEHYWFLLERMNESSEKISEFKEFYTKGLNEDERAFFDNVMQEVSLSKGQIRSTIQGLPGRSTLVSAYADLIMRKGLRFVWMAFFQENVEVEFTLQEVFDNYREIVRNNPLADVFLLVNKKYESKGNAVAMSPEELILNALPGDQILVRCGRLSHYSTVWNVNKAKNEVLLLDPFDEFWQPSHNRCVTVFERHPYKHKRQLTRVSYSELEKMLVTVLSIRNRV